MSEEHSPITTTTTAQQLIQLKREEEMQKITESQNQSLVAFMEAEQKLDAFNRFSQARYQNVHKQFEMHAQLLKDVKDDLDSVFRKISIIKGHLASKHPTETRKALEKYPPKVVAEEDEEQYEGEQEQREINFA